MMAYTVYFSISINFYRYWRPPPRGFKSDNYSLCENFRETGSCRYGIQCVQAHGEDELNEWKERFHYREMKLQRAREKELFGEYIFIPGIQIVVCRTIAHCSGIGHPK